MNKFYINTSGPHVEDIEKAFTYAILLANKDKDVRRIIFYSYQKRNFVQVEQFFKEKFKIQLPTKGVNISEMNVLVKCETKITYHKQSGHDKTDVVIACHMSSDDIYILDDDEKVKYIIAIPWLEHDVDKWVYRWSAEEISGKDMDKQAEKTTDPLLIIALKEMDVRMFETKSFSHMSDEETCKTYIRTIHKYLPNVTPDNIENYLIRNLFWSAANANKVGNLLRRLKEGRTFRGGGKTGLQNYYKNWKHKLESKTKP